MIDMNDAWYRVSAKAIVRNESGKVMLCRESNGTWDIPWGGLDHGEDPKDCVRRELLEEMGLVATAVSEAPCCFVAVSKPGSKSRPWIANVCYETRVEPGAFVPTDECQEIGYFDLADIAGLPVIANVSAVFAELFPVSGKTDS